MQKKVTMKDIANKLELSINAISLALNDKVGLSEETRSLILKTAQEMGYLDQTRKYEKTFSSKNLCILIKRIYFRDMHFYSKVLLGIEEEAKKNSYDVIISVLDNDEIPNCIEKRRVSGIIVVGKIDTDYLKRVKQYQIPVILVDTTSQIEATDSVMTNNRLGAYQAVRYLIDKGFKKIGFFGDLDYTVSVRERYWGYQEGLKHLQGIQGYSMTFQYSEKYSVLSDIEQHVIDKDVDQIIERVKSVKIMPEVFFCSNDNAAIQLCNALKMLGYNIPSDISVMGFDDLDLCTMVMPKITTVCVNKELMGKRAIQLYMWRLLNQDDPAQKIMISTEIKERDSVVKPETD